MLMLVTTGQLRHERSNRVLLLLSSWPGLVLPEQWTERICNCTCRQCLSLNCIHSPLSFHKRECSLVAEAAMSLVLDTSIWQGQVQDLTATAFCFNISIVVEMDCAKV